MADPAYRLDRLIGLLPRLFAPRGPASGIGAFLAIMADRLSELDDDLTRVLHDRWVGLANGDPASDDAAAMPGALERLGSLIDTPRLRRGRDVHAGDDRAGENVEGTEDYRARLGITARVLTAGLATPHAILSLAIADLGLDPCPLMTTLWSAADASERDGARRVEATLAWGVPAATRRACPLCGPLHGLDGSGAEAPCPNRNHPPVTAWISENPTTQARHEQKQAALWRPFTVLSHSLAADRPTVEIRALGQDLSYPALQNRVTGEIMLFADVLRANEVLAVRPAIAPAERRRFDSYDGIEHHDWLAAHPAGQAVVTGADGRPRDVGAKIFFLSGSRFEELSSTFAGADAATGTRFSVLEQRVQTPLLRPGASVWRLLQFADPGARFDASTSRLAPVPGNTAPTRFASWDRGVGASSAEHVKILFDSLRTAEDSAARQATGETPAVADVTLEWFTRPPATFRLRIPRNAWIEQAEARGAIDLLRADVTLARPAGVQALIDFPQPPLRDAHPIGDDFRLSLAQSWRDDAEPLAMPVRLAVRQTLREAADIEDGGVTFGGLFDATRLDRSRFR